MHRGVGVHADVLVVGAGPTGMLLAIELARQGLSVRIIDLGTGPTQVSKAQVIQARTLEILDQLGIVGRFLEHGRPLHRLSMYSPEMERLFHIDVGEPDSQYPFMLNLPQRETELLLAEHLGRLGVCIDRQMQLIDLRQDDREVIALVQHVGSQAMEELHAAWLVGCDGVHSTVRGALGLAFSGSTYAHRVLQADMRIDWPLQHADDEIVGFASQHGPLGAFPLPGEHRYRLLTFDAGLAPSLENFQFLLDTRGPKGAYASCPTWMAEYTIHCRMVSEFRVGRVFLAGDAAHSFSPATGQGMNCGMQDAHNLAWKLALVHKGLGRLSVLDSYAAERAPATRALLQITDSATRGLQELLTLFNPVARELGHRLLRFVASLGLVQHRVSRSLSMLDVGYHKSPLVDQNHEARAVMGDEAGEPISLHAWLDFERGPEPGERAFDGPLVDISGRGVQWLFQLFSGSKHTLLLFIGTKDSDMSYDRLTDIERWAYGRYPEQLETYLVQIVPRPDEPRLVPREGPLLFDRHGVLHHAYGASSECLYLIRPDGYVGYRAQPAERQRFSDYLVQLFN